MVKLHSSLNIEWLQTLLSFRHIWQFHFEPAGGRMQWCQWGPLASDSLHQTVRSKPRWSLSHLQSPPEYLKNSSSFTSHQSLLSETAVVAADPHSVRFLNPNENLACSISFSLPPHENGTAFYTSLRREFKARTFLSTLTVQVHGSYWESGGGGRLFSF
jgi:hypothetical protein